MNTIGPNTKPWGTPYGVNPEDNVSVLCEQANLTQQRHHCAAADCDLLERKIDILYNMFTNKQGAGMGSNYSGDKWLGNLVEHKPCLKWC